MLLSPPREPRMLKCSSASSARLPPPAAKCLLDSALWYLGSTRRHRRLPSVTARSCKVLLGCSEVFFDLMNCAVWSEFFFGVSLSPAVSHACYNSQKGGHN